MHPEVQARCQAEIDRVVGPDRLPSYDDENELVYIKATVRELFRWRPVGPTAIPHASVEVSPIYCFFNQLRLTSPTGRHLQWLFHPQRRDGHS